MKTKQDLIDAMESQKAGQQACHEAVIWVSKQDGTAQEIWDRCERGDWLLWLAARSEVDHKLIVKAACLCARTALKYVPSGENRPLKCIEATERWVLGEATFSEVQQARLEAIDAEFAARAAYSATSAATAAATAAGYAAGAATATYSATATATATVVDSTARAAIAAAYATSAATAAATAADAYSAVVRAAYDTLYATVYAASAAVDATAYARKDSLKQCADLVRTVIGTVPL